MNRRNFLKLSSATIASAWLAEYGLSPAIGVETISGLRLKNAKSTPAICGLCAAGCGINFVIRDSQLIDIEGDINHPINKGALCIKGQALIETRRHYSKRGVVEANPHRNTKVLYRGKGQREFDEKSWPWALKKITEKIKRTRDKYFITSVNGATVNRLQEIAFLVGGGLNNEELYSVQKFARSLGTVHIESTARACHDPIYRALLGTFGRGVSTNHMIDMKNAGAILCVGANPAENQPVAMRWINAARDKGAMFIHIDPRFNPSSSISDFHIPIRPGTDLAFLGGLINYAIDNDLYDTDYLFDYTDGPFLLNESYYFKDGIFSGYSKANRSYDKSSWSYQNTAADDSFRAGTVFQALKKHYRRYTPEKVCVVCGIDKKLFMDAAKSFAATGKSVKPGVILMGSGITQHISGTQNVRAAAILQILLGNIGVAGGGICFIGGSANSQGSLDMGLAADLLPGYLPAPTTDRNPNLQSYANEGPLMISLLRAYYGDYASASNDYAFELIPKRQNGKVEESFYHTLSDGNIKGLFAWGSNPAVSGPNTSEILNSLEKLEWLVAVDLWNSETAQFWNAPNKDAKSIDTEVFLLPAATSFEKSGSKTNSGRWIQWCDKIIEPPGQAKSDLWIADQLFRSVQKKYSSVIGKVPEMITKMNWDYGNPEPNAELVAAEINGFEFGNKKPLEGLAGLKGGGGIACGNSYYSGYFNLADKPASEQPCGRRDNFDPSNIGLYSGWSFSWPNNVRILYNRASVNKHGKPINPDARLVEWGNQKWILQDIADFSYILQGKKVKLQSIPAFATSSHGRAKIFADAFADGPLPEYYEPNENSVDNILSKTQSNPIEVAQAFLQDTKQNDLEFPLMLTTFRLAEHSQAGQMSRNLSWLAEITSEMFIEISAELAEDKDIKNGEKVTVFNNRGHITAYALVTHRLKPIRIGKRDIHILSAPWHWGFAGLTTGDSANMLTAPTQDLNSMAFEYKSLPVDIRKGSG